MLSMASDPKKLREQRESLGLTLDEVASATGLDRSTIFRIEHGERTKPRTVRRVEAALREAQVKRDNLSEPVTADIAPQPTPGSSSAMGQMVGQMQYAAGGGPDPYESIVEVATENDDPPTVFKRLALLRSEAPPGAKLSWWVNRYLDMGGGGKRRSKN